MKREVFELIEASRGLNIQRVPKPGHPKNIRIIGKRHEFPDRLHRVAAALEAVDRAGARSLQGGDVDPSMDAAKLRMAIDGVFRWMRSMGMDVSEPHSVVAAALGVRVKKPKAYKPQPRFGPGTSKKVVGGKPLLKIHPDAGERLSYEVLRQRALQHQEVTRMMGAAAPRM